MPVRVKKSHSALKHGGYSATTILPGESKADFEKLHRDLIDDLTPNGSLEEPYRCDRGAVSMAFAESRNVSNRGARSEPSPATRR
jgi:hypothetical protein